MSQSPRNLGVRTPPCIEITRKQTLMLKLLSAGLMATSLGIIGAGSAAAQQDGPAAIPQSREDAKPGGAYSIGTFDAWSVRCMRAADAQSDPCEMNQLLRTPDGNPTAEINLFIVGEPGVPAGATIVTPLETLLTKGLSVNIDGNETGKIYPFQLCTRQGCVAQIGITDAEIAQMRTGSRAVITIYPAASPDTPVTLEASLEGFATAYTMIDTP